MNSLTLQDSSRRGQRALVAALAEATPPSPSLVSAPLHPDNLADHTSASRIHSSQKRTRRIQLRDTGIGHVCKADCKSKLLSFSKTKQNAEYKEFWGWA